MPIVTGYEDTPGGHDALVLGAQLARLTEVAAVVATVHPADSRGLAAVAKDPRWKERAAAVAARRFATAITVIGSDGWGPADPEFVVIGPGMIADELGAYAEDAGAAVLVVGSTGHGLLGRIVPGRIVHRLLTAVSCPVAIAPRGYRHTATERITSVTVAYDGTPEADRAAAVAVHLAARSGALLRFVTVAPEESQVPAAIAVAQKGLAGAPVDMNVVADVAVGPAAEVLADLPRHLSDAGDRADLLVIGARGYQRMRSLLLGGVVGALVRTARHPVVVVPAPAAD